MKRLSNVISISILLLFYACSTEENYISLVLEEEQEILSQTLNLPITEFNYANIALPSSFFNSDLMQEDNTPVNNNIRNKVATLGRVLFYDTALSKNNTVSCASCHQQEKSFSDSNRFSEGFAGGKTLRNSMSLVNARFYRNKRFFWDERASSLEEQVLMPIQDHVEMGLSLDELEAKLNTSRKYKILFKRAFGDTLVNSQRIAQGLAQFVRALVSYQSKFDEGLAQTNNVRRPFANFTNSENRGKQLFFSPQTNCSQCHITTAFIGDRARNNGLEAEPTDLGVGGITGQENDMGAFKVPSLRNVQVTAPFMHDGRFTTLEQVIEHYNSGIVNSVYLDARLRRRNGPRRLNLSALDKLALKDFLLTLTDSNFLVDEKFSSPFKNK